MRSPVPRTLWGEELPKGLEMIPPRVLQGGHSRGSVSTGNVQRRDGEVPSGPGAGTRLPSPVRKENVLGLQGSAQTSTSDLPQTDLPGSDSLPSGDPVSSPCGPSHLVQD